MDEAVKPPHLSKDSGTTCAGRRYVNQIELGFSLSEIRIDLSQEFPGSGSDRTQCSLVTSPVHLRRIGNAITRTIDRYESRFGAIPNAESATESQGGEHG